MSLMYPSVDELLEKVDSRYKLVALASKRALELDEFDRIKANAESRDREVALDENDKTIAPTLSEFQTVKNVGHALEEINDGNVVIDTDKNADVEN
jgi:DNA-directed RNA polymerase subunit omega